jgi:hypothetical protein
MIWKPNFVVALILQGLLLNNFMPLLEKKSKGRSRCSDAKMVTEEVWGEYFTGCAGLTEGGPPMKRTRGGGTHVTKDTHKARTATNRK